MLLCAYWGSIYFSVCTIKRLKSLLKLFNKDIKTRRKSYCKSYIRDDKSSRISSKKYDKSHAIPSAAILNVKSQVKK